jgi:hypothetical protein
MMQLPLPLFAQEALSSGYELKNIQSNSDWILPIALFLAVAVYVVWMYRRDSGELPRLVATLLTLLRLATFAALLAIYVHPEKKVEKTTNSRVLVMVDTSRSMGKTDPDAGSSNSLSRVQQVGAALRQTELLNKLRQTHDVVVAPFDEDLHRDRIKILPKFETNEDANAKDEPAAGKKPDSLAAASDPADDGSPDAKPSDDPAKTDQYDWSKILPLSGQETRLSQAVRQLINDQTNARLSGVIIFTDGGQNAGESEESAIEAANQARVPLVPVGIGSDKVPPHVRIASFNPPPRAFPGDPYAVPAALQAWRMAGQTVTVQLLSRKSGNSADDRGTGDVLETQSVTLGADGEEVPVKFTLRPDEVGRRILSLKVIAPPGDNDKSGQLVETSIQIVDSKNRVLLLAGGPTREYQFLRNQLYRDKSTVSDLFLQSGKSGISQESHEILTDFPATREAMYKYDCVVAFDPDWQSLSAAQIDLLETWVGEEGGGLIVIPGPVYAGRPLSGWVQDKAMTKIRALYPVQFDQRYSGTDNAMELSEKPWQVNVTREGMDADFLAIADSTPANREAWDQLKVFSYYPIRKPKPLATVLAKLSDSAGAAESEKPVYMAWQFYGAGQVFYLGSGEMWRLRGIKDTYFEAFYTKVIRHASKGRLLRGSQRGTLLVSEERYLLGSSVTVRAHRLTNAQLEPLQLPSIALQVISEQGIQNVTLQRDTSKPGSYSGQFVVLETGPHRLELPLPDSSEERLTQEFNVQIPNLEQEHLERNDKLLGDLAKKTYVWEDVNNNGAGDAAGKSPAADANKTADESQKQSLDEKEREAAANAKRLTSEYYIGISELIDPPAGKRPLGDLLKDRVKTSPAGFSPIWDEQWLRWMMIAIFSLLCLEWLIRRLFRLA